MPIQGEIIVDEGAAKAILGRKSLFAAGVLDVKGIFGARDGKKISDNLLLFAQSTNLSFPLCFS